MSKVQSLDMQGTASDPGSRLGRQLAVCLARTRKCLQASQHFAGEQPSYTSFLRSKASSTAGSARAKQEDGAGRCQRWKNLGGERKRRIHGVLVYPKLRRRPRGKVSANECAIHGSLASTDSTIAGDDDPRPVIDTIDDSHNTAPEADEPGPSLCGESQLTRTDSEATALSTPASPIEHVEADEEQPGSSDTGACVVRAAQLVGTTPDAVHDIVKLFEESLAISVASGGRAGAKSHPPSLGAGPAGSDAGGRPSLPGERSGAGGGAKRKQTADDDAQDNDNNCSVATSKRQRRGSDLPYYVACPFYKRDPIRYIGCLLRNRIRTTAYLRQHLKRYHAQPIHCPICGAIFESRTVADAHIRGSQCEHASFVHEGIPEDRMRACERVSRQGSEQDRWYGLWDILFPDHPHPPSPYVMIHELEEMLNLFHQFFLCSSHGTLADYLRDQRLSNIFGELTEEDLTRMELEILERIFNNTQLRDMVTQSPSLSRQQSGVELQTHASTSSAVIVEQVSQDDERENVAYLAHETQQSFQGSGIGDGSGGSALPFCHGSTNSPSI